MSTRERPYSRPERILLVVARRSGDCRGKAVRIADESEFRFDTVGELAKWLSQEPQPKPDKGDGEE